MSVPSPALFVTATGTGCGKTWLSRGLARALLRRGLAVAAVKPIETGVEGVALDALALARAAGQPALASAPGLLRARLPAAPYAAVLAGELGPIDPSALAETVRRLAAESDVVIAEGAGGLLVPLSAEHTTADLVSALGWPVVLAARDAVGTLSHVLTALESAATRSLSVRAVVLIRGPWSEGDPTTATNARILAEHASIPILSLRACRDDDEDLADAAEPLLGPIFGL